MAAGKPIVATNVGGIPDVVKNEHNGYLSSYSDVNAFSNNIDRVINCRTTRISMSKRNRADAQVYLWSSIADKVTSVYKNL
jgi:glycosyltransferase involved in cell wall biosynthesis